MPPDPSQAKPRTAPNPAEVNPLSGPMARIAVGHVFGARLPATTAVPPRRVGLPLFLFVATCFSTFYVAATDWNPLLAFGYWDLVGGPNGLLSQFWQQGLTYMGAVLAILLTHEMGHFVTTLRYGIPASYPYFIPVPVNPIGTMGAVIGMDGLKADRKELFDLGLSGPLAGLVVAVPVLWIGIRELDLSQPAAGIAFHCPLLVQILCEYVRPDLVGKIETVSTSQLNPYFMAGWVGMFVTGLNMLPISQLDGGHTIYALFGRRAHSIARAFLIVVILYIIVNEAYFWIVMLLLVILIGTDHPPTSNDRAKLGTARWVIGVASLSIPILCLAPKGIDV